MPSPVHRWRQASLSSPVRPVPEAPRPRSRKPLNSRLLMTGLACCSAIVAGRVHAQATVPWKIVQVEIQSSANSDQYSFFCEYASDSNLQTWSSATGLQGSFSSGTTVSYECCSGGYYYGYYCDTYSMGTRGSVVIGSSTFSVWADGCMEDEYCSCDVTIEIVFDRPMRMVWPDCCRGSDVGYDYGCPLDGGGFPQEGPCGKGSVEFPYAGGAGPYYHYQSSYSFTFDSASGNWSEAQDVRFERIYPADVVPNGVVDGADISAILSKWGGPYDPQRTAADVNLDGQVGAEDLALVLFAWDTPG